MATPRKIIFCLLALIFSAFGLRAAGFAETRDFRAANLSFSVHAWTRAEKEFADFVERFPKSEHRSEAVLLQAEARYYQTNSDGAINLLEANVDRAEVWADEYRFWIAEAWYQKGDYADAAVAYARLLSLHGMSKRRLESMVGEAAARSRIGQWDQVIASLGRPDGEFSYAATTALTNEMVVRGLLLLAEARLARKKFEAAEATLVPLTALQLDPVLGWRVEHLRCEARRAGGRLSEALATSSNLVAIASHATNVRAPLLAESVAMQAAILDELGRRYEAVAVWKQNLSPGTPPDRQREALLKAAQINLALGRNAEAAETLERFLNDNTNAPAGDAAMLTLGELELKQNVLATGTNATPRNGGTNHLELALGWFTRLINNFSNSTLIGKAELNRGWSYWLRGDWTNSADSFTRAVARLSDPEDLAVARFKLGDALFEQENFAWARENYRAAVELAARAPRLRESLSAAAWYQILSSDVKLNNEAGAQEALSRIWQMPLESGDPQRATMLAGQSYLDTGKPAKALELFEKFVTLFSSATNRAEAELLIARTREQQSDWAGAMTNYTQWIERYPTNALRPQAELQRALAAFRAGDETNALAVMSNFVVSFKTNALAPRAMWWLADYYFRRPEFPEAEKGYKVLFQEWPDSELADEAKMMAGRAAVGWHNYGNAIEYFTLLTGTNTPSPLWAQAVFAYGDTLMLQAAADTNKLANYSHALQVLGKIHEKYQTNEIAGLAWGEMAKCYSQMGSTGWSNAVFAYRKVIEFPAARIAARSEAKVGLGSLQEEMARLAPTEERVALLKSAAEHYWDVVLEKNLREGESRDAFWIQRAGLAGARLLGSLRDWERLLKLCERMEELLPVSNSQWQRRIEDVKRNLGAEKN